MLVWETHYWGGAARVLLRRRDCRIDWRGEGRSRWEEQGVVLDVELNADPNLDLTAGRRRKPDERLRADLVEGRS
jgi:hypothetical protein